MKENIVFSRDSKNVKKPYHLKNNILLLYAQRNIKIDPMEYRRQDSDIVVFMPKNSKCFLTSKLREEEIEQIWNYEQRLCIVIWNKSCKELIEIKKNSVLGFFVLETKQDIEIKHEIAQATAYQKRQKQGFLNRYNFAYAGRDVADQAVKVTPGLI